MPDSPPLSSDPYSTQHRFPSGKSFSRSRTHSPHKLLSCYRPLHSTIITHSAPLHCILDPLASRSLISLSILRLHFLAFLSYVCKPRIESLIDKGTMIKACDHVRLPLCSGMCWEKAWTLWRLWSFAAMEQKRGERRWCSEWTFGGGGMRVCIGIGVLIWGGGMGLVLGERRVEFGLEDSFREVQGYSFQLKTIGEAESTWKATIKARKSE
ncbi:hypothetical protein BKA64DRAFT_289915 [Cadophora sp. MPI-SDFR-AT-0126]|nr:hypothetical protein BKA64DRAFT_289915 [Leotiomycetes sp. MPI-SDFR-AT-0126]